MSHSLFPLRPALAATLFLTLALGSPARGQGLLGIGHEGSRITEGVPVKVGIGAWAGYDTNANTAPSGSREKTAYYGGRAALRWAHVTSQTRFDLRFHFTGLHQEAGGGSLDDMIYNTRLKADLGHRFNERASLTNNTLVSWEVEPDFLVAASTSRRDDQYLHFWNRTALWYSLNNRFTSVSSYTIEGVSYDKPGPRAAEDRVAHLFGQQARYAWSSDATLKAEYRHGIRDYRAAPLDSNSHYLLAGADRQFGESALLTFLAGAEQRNHDAFPSLWKPYAEASLLHRLGDATTLRWMGRAGLEDNEVSGFASRYGLRAGLAVTHAITDQLGASAGLSYVYSDFEGIGAARDIHERGFQVHADLTYALLPNLDLSAGYQYVDYGSDDPSREYERHRVSVAATTTF